MFRSTDTDPVTAMQVLQSADVKARLQKNCAKYAESLDQREVLHLLLRISKLSNHSKHYMKLVDGTGKQSIVPHAPTLRLLTEVLTSDHVFR